MVCVCVWCGGKLFGTDRSHKHTPAVHWALRDSRCCSYTTSFCNCSALKMERALMGRHVHTHVCVSMMVAALHWLVLLVHWVNDIFQLLNKPSHKPFCIKTLFTILLHYLPHGGNYSFYPPYRGIYCSPNNSKTLIHTHTHSHSLTHSYTLIH